MAVAEGNRKLGVLFVFSLLADSLNSEILPRV